MSAEQPFAIDFDRPSRPMLERFHQIQMETWMEICGQQATPSLREAHAQFRARVEAEWGPMTQEQFEGLIMAFVDMVIVQLGGEP
jgi:predicted HicB family RNase H-like nuclease